MKVTTLGRNAAGQAMVSLVDADASPGYMEIRSGTPPTSAQDAATGTVLATAVLAQPAFDAVGTTGPGIAVAEPIAVVSGVANGNATWFRVYDGADTKIWDGTCSAVGGGGEAELNTVAISIGVDVAVVSWSVNYPES